MSTTLGIAIIGCGDRGQQNGRHFQAREDCAVRMVQDPDRQRAEALAGDLGAAVIEDWRDAIGVPGIDVVVICTPAAFHAEIGIAAAQAGQHIFCEKPIDLSGEAGRRLALAVETAGVQMAICFQYREQPLYRKLRAMFRAGELRGPLMARFADAREVRPKTAMHDRALNGGPVIDMAGHWFDLMRHITGAEAIRVFASGHVFGADKPCLAAIGDPAIDAAEIQVQFTGGHIASLQLNWGLPEQTPACMYRCFQTRDLVLRSDHEGRWWRDSGAQSEALELPEGDDLQRCIGALIDAIHGRASDMATADDGLKALEISLAALESIRSGQPVELAPAMSGSQP